MAESGICIVGPMTGRNAGWVTSQGEFLADALSADGARVWTASPATTRLRRLVDIVIAVVRNRSRARVLVVETYGGRAFVLEDVATALGRLLGYRIVLHLHGGAMPEFVQRFPHWSRRVLGRADALVAPTAYLARALGELGYQVDVIPNVVDVATYPFRPRARVAPRMLWMRSFHSLYNAELAVRALARVRETLPDATLVLAGQDKGALHAVRTEVERLGLTEAVRFVGFLDHAGKLREGAAADVFVSTNRVDNAPVAVIEAGALGLPVVATDVGGLRDLLRGGEAALLVPDDDADAMATAIVRLVREPALAARLSAAGRAVAEGCSWGRVGPQWHRVLGASTPAAGGAHRSRVPARETA